MDFQFDDITPKEKIVLYAIARGASSKQIAIDLGVNVRTIEKHRSHIIQKLKLDGEANCLTRWALINRNWIFKSDKNHD